MRIRYLLVCLMMVISQNVLAQSNAALKWRNGGLEHHAAGIWNVMAGQVSSTACSVGGRFDTFGGTEYYCNGSNWVNPSCGVTNGSCSNLGAREYANGAYQTCDGSQWRVWSTSPCAVGIASNIYCWGSTTQGGMGVTSTSLVPINVAKPDGVGNFSSVAIGQAHTCALTDFQAYCWGYNATGQLGNNTTISTSLPVQVLTSGTLSGFVQIATGYDHTCGISQDSKAYCWGFGSSGRLGRNSIAAASYPAAVIMPSGVAGFKEVGAGDDHTCALTVDNQVYCWGKNDVGQIGDNGSADVRIPIAVISPTNVFGFKSLSVGSNHNCAIGFNDQAYCWGENSNGQLGNNTTILARTPQLVTLPSGVTSFKAITARADHGTCAIGNDDKGYCWGKGSFGRLGNNGTSDSAIPVPVVMPSGILGFSSISSGALGTSCAIANTGQMYCWGSAPVGTGSGVSSRIPVLVSPPTGTTSFSTVTGGYDYACGIAN